VHVACNVIVMMLAWAMLLLLRWVILDSTLLAQCSELFAAVVLAIVVSGVSMLTIWLLPAAMRHFMHTIGKQQRMRRRKRVIRLIMQSMSLVCAWSWEQCFDKAMDAIASEGWVRVGSKFIVALVLTAVQFPVYVTFLKPYTKHYEAQDD